jgi:hypothetical protein
MNIHNCTSNIKLHALKFGRGSSSIAYSRKVFIEEDIYHFRLDEPVVAGFKVLGDSDRE